MVEGGEAEKERIMKRILLLINCIIQVIGTCGGPLVVRLYFLNGGNRTWLSCLLQAAGFPILFIPLIISYITRRRNHKFIASNDTSTGPKIVSMKLPLFLVFSVIGVLQGLDNILYANGLAWLPVSTSVLIISTQLAFTAIFAFILVGQKFTAYSVNAVVMLILGAVVLALNGGGDKAVGETQKQYVKGFVMTVAAAVLYGVILPVVELVYKKAKQPITYTLVLEIQLVVSFFGTVFAIVGMLINHDFQAIPKEAKHFKLGENTYYVLLVVIAILWQLSNLGAMGVIFCASSLMSGIMVAMSTPITEVLAVIFYKEKFQAIKGISLVLSIWGFLSYFYGEYKETRKLKKDTTPENILP